MNTRWDDGPSGRPQLQFAWPPLTPVVKRLLIVNIAIFFAVFMLGFVSLEFRAEVIGVLALDPARWRDWFPFVPAWQLATYGFVHDVHGLGHLFFNMLSLYFFGGMVEGIVGSRRFAVHYAAALLVAGAVHLLVSPLVGAERPAIGASGACLAAIVSAATMRPNATVYLLVFPVPLKFLAAGLVALDVFAMLSQMQGAGHGPTAIYIHLAGALYGFLAVRRRWIWADPLASLERRRAVAAAERRLSAEARMDELLAKINREGLGSLSARERDFLKRESERGR